MASKGSKNYSVRFTTEGDKEVTSRVEQMADRVDRAFARVGRAGEGPSNALRQIGKSSQEAEAGIAGAIAETERMSLAISDLKNIGTVAATGLTVFAGIAVKALGEFAEAELSSKRLDAVLLATGGSAKVSAQEVSDFADEVARRTIFTTEKVKDASAVMLTFQSVTGDTFKRAMMAAIDLSAVTGQDLVSSVRQYGKALEDPVKGLSSLREAGITFTNQQRIVIQTLADSGDKAGAMTALLDALEGKTKGVADAMGNTLTGSLTHAKDAFGNLLENFGEIINRGDRVTHTVQGLAGYVNELSDALSDLEKKHKDDGFLQFLFDRTGPGFIKNAYETLTQVSDNRIKDDTVNKIKEFQAKFDEFNKSSNPPATIAQPKLQSPGLAAYLKSLEQEKELVKETGRQRAIDNALIKAKNKATADGLSLTDEDRKKVTDLAGAIYDASHATKAHAVAKKEQTERLKEYIEKLQDESAQVRLSERDQKIQQALQEAANLARQDHKRLTDADIESVKSLVGATYDYVDAQNKSKVAAEEQKRQRDEQLRQQRDIQKKLIDDFNRPFENAMDSFQETITDKIRHGFKGGMDDALDIFKDYVAQMATLLLFRPEVLYAGGVSALGSGVISGSAYGGAGLNPLSALSSSTALLSKISGASILPPSLTGGVADISTKLFGDKLLFGNLADGLSLGAVGGGLGGQLLSKAIFGSKGIGSTGGGIAGQLGGAALGTEFLTPFFGAAAGPLGALAGSFFGSTLGGALTGLFSGKPSDKTAAGSVGLGAGGLAFDLSSATGKKADPQNIQLRNSVLSYASALTSEINEALGSAIKSQLTVQIGNREGYRFRLGDGAEQSFGRDANAFMQALTSQVVNLGKGAGVSSSTVAELQTAIKHIDFSDTTKALSDLQFVLGFDKLGDTTEALSQVQQSVKDLNAVFDAYRQTADRLGISVEKVNAAQQKQVQNIRDQYLGSVNDALLSSLLPNYSQLKALADKYAQDQKDAVALGLKASDIAKITQTYQLNVASIVSSNSSAIKDQAQDAQQLIGSYSNLSDSFSSLLSELQNGQFSILSPVANLAELRQKIANDNSVAGNTSDPEAAAAASAELVTLIPQFLQLSQTLNNGNKDFVKDQQFAIGVAKSAKSVAEQQRDIAQGILSQATSATNLLGQIAQGSAGGGTLIGGNANDKLVKALNIGYNGLTNAQIDAIFQSAGVTVQPGEGRRTAFLNDPAHAGINSSLNALFHAYGVPGFAKGGLVGGGTKGQDSVPALLMPDERVLTVSQDQKLETIYKASSSRGAGNDNRTVEELRGLSEAIERLIIATVNVGKANSASLDALKVRASDVASILHSARLRGDKRY